MRYNEEALLDLVQETSQMLVITPTMRSHAWDAIDNKKLRKQLKKRDTVKKDVMRFVRFFLEELDHAFYGHKVVK